MNNYKDELQEFIGICKYMDSMERALLYASGLDREDAYKHLYDKAFSEEVNDRLQQIYAFDWCDIDAGYDDDYLSWKSGLNEARRVVERMLSRY